MIYTAVQTIWRSSKLYITVDCTLRYELLLTAVNHFEQHTAVIDTHGVRVIRVILISYGGWIPFGDHPLKLERYREY